VQADDDGDVAENGENEKLSPEPKMRDASTSMSQERLSLMIKYNQIGSVSLQKKRREKHGSQLEFSLSFSLFFICCRSRRCHVDLK
jgi:hypothetical protein